MARLCRSSILQRTSGASTAPPPDVAYERQAWVAQPRVCSSVGLRLMRLSRLFFCDRCGSSENDHVAHRQSAKPRSTPAARAARNKGRGGVGPKAGPSLRQPLFWLTFVR